MLVLAPVCRAVYRPATLYTELYNRVYADSASTWLPPTSAFFIRFPSNEAKSMFQKISSDMEETFHRNDAGFHESCKTCST